MSARKGGTDTKWWGAHPAPSRPVPRAELHTNASWMRPAQAGIVEPPAEIQARSDDGHSRGFDAQAWTRVSLNSCPDDELAERGMGARPNLENSTACQKSMPINLVARWRSSSHPAV